MSGQGSMWDSPGTPLSPSLLGAQSPDACPMVPAAVCSTLASGWKSGKMEV